MDAPFVAAGKPADLSTKTSAAFRLGLPFAVTLLIALYAVAVSLVIMPSNVDVS